jgi:hypothetical protein
MGPVSNLECCLFGKREVLMLCDRDLGLKKFERFNKNNSNYRVNKPFIIECLCKMAVASVNLPLNPIKTQFPMLI